VKRAACALVSGGLDSCVMLAELARRYRNVYPVFIRYGLVWERAELQHLKKFLRRAKIPRIQSLTVLDLPVRDLYGVHWSTTGRKVPQARTPDKAVYLPGRNLLLLSKAAVFCALNKIDTIAIGSLDHNPFPDATPRFFREFATVAGEALNFRLKVIAPFRALAKRKVLHRGKSLPLHLSFSCISPRRELHCGRCNKCAERQQAFLAAKIVDRTKYAGH
jgi:7-cyano-7-deazaguanine synthase